MAKYLAKIEIFIIIYIKYLPQILAKWKSQ